jgi:hypothetical protein
MANLCLNCNKPLPEASTKPRKFCNDKCKSSHQYNARSIKIASDEEIKGFSWKQAEDWMNRYPDNNTESIKNLAETCYRMPNTSESVCMVELRYLKNDRSIPVLAGFTEVYKEVIAESNKVGR